MYESLVQWCRFPVNIHAYTGTGADGSPAYSSPRVVNGYIVDEMRRITDKNGVEYPSMTHIYFPGTTSISVEDMISFQSDPRLREIRRLGSYFDGNTGKLSAWLVYL